MTVRVRLFALAREKVGRSDVEMEMEDSATVGELRRLLRERWPELGGLWAGVMIAVDQAYAGDDVGIEASSAVAVIPPVSGGVLGGELGGVGR